MSVRNFSSVFPSGDFIAGLVDGEGCFALKFRRETKENRPSKAIYFGWQAAFIIALRKDDVGLLEKVQKVLGCGRITFSGNNARYHVQSTDDLVNKIVPFFEQYKLFGKKSKDFVLWTEAVKLIALNKKKSVNAQRGVRGFVRVNWDMNDLARLKEIRGQMIEFKSARSLPFKWVG